MRDRILASADQVGVQVLELSGEMKDFDGYPESSSGEFLLTPAETITDAQRIALDRLLCAHGARVATEADVTADSDA